MTVLIRPLSFAKLMRLSRDITEGASPHVSHKGPTTLQGPHAAAQSRSRRKLTRTRRTDLRVLGHVLWLPRREAMHFPIFLGFLDPG